MAPIKLSFQNDYKIDERFGKYPADWVLHRMGDLGDFLGGATPSTQQPSYWNGSINWLVPSDISTLPEEQKYIYDTGDKITEAGLAACSAVLLPAGTVTMSSRATLGDCVIFGKEMCTNQGFISCKCNDLINNEYLLYWIRQCKNYISRYAAGTTFLEIGRRQFKKLRIAIPEPQEQALIVGALADIDRAIEVTRKAIDQAGLVKKALMQHLLSGRLKPDGTWRKPDEFYMDEKFGRVPKGWTTPRVKEFVDFLRRGRSPEYTESSIYVPVINQKCIEWDRINFDYVKHHDPQVKVPDEFFLLDQDILVNSTGTGTIGRIAMFHGYDYPCFADGHLTIIRTSRKVVQPKFLKYYLMSYNGQRHLESFCYSGSTNQIELSRSYFLNMRVPMPDNPDEQIAISDKIELSQKYIECSERKINSLQRLKKSLMQNLLTGKIRVQAE